MFEGGRRFVQERDFKGGSRSEVCGSSGGGGVFGMWLYTDWVAYYLKGGWVGLGTRFTSLYLEDGEETTSKRETPPTKPRLLQRVEFNDYGYNHVSPWCDYMITMITMAIIN
jgi:hypothetical protein